METALQSPGSQVCSELETMVAMRNRNARRADPACELCGDAGGHEEVDGIYTRWVPCECSGKKRAQRVMESSGLADRMQSCSFATFRTKIRWQQDIKRLAQRYVDEGSGWFYIGGQVGSGKTHLCIAIVNDLIWERRCHAKYMVWPEAVDSIKGNAEDSARTIKQYFDVPVLYIDDFLKSPRSEGEKPAAPTEGELRAAFKIINHRYNQNDLITIFSSEHLLGEVTAFDNGIGGRISERCGAFKLDVSRDARKNVRLAE